MAPSASEDKSDCFRHIMRRWKAAVSSHTRICPIMPHCYKKVRSGKRGTHCTVPNNYTISTENRKRQKSQILYKWMADNQGITRGLCCAGMHTGGPASYRGVRLRFGGSVHITLKLTCLALIGTNLAAKGTPLEHRLALAIVRSSPFLATRWTKSRAHHSVADGASPVIRGGVTARAFAVRLSWGGTERDSFEIFIGGSYRAGEGL